MHWQAKKLFEEADFVNINRNNSYRIWFAFMSSVRPSPLLSITKKDKVSKEVHEH